MPDDYILFKYHLYWWRKITYCLLPWHFVIYWHFFFIDKVCIICINLNYTNSLYSNYVTYLVIYCTMASYITIAHFIHLIRTNNYFHQLLHIQTRFCCALHIFLYILSKIRSTRSDFAAIMQYMNLIWNNDNKHFTTLNSIL